MRIRATFILAVLLALGAEALEKPSFAEFDAKAKSGWHGGGAGGEARLFATRASLF